MACRSDLVARRPTVLVLMGAFWPGHDAAGPNQSLRGFCSALADDFDFRIVARDRPFNAKARTAPREAWTDLGFAHAAFLQPGLFAVWRLRELLRASPVDLVMINGFFDRDLTLPYLLLRRLGLVAGRPVILSPRGEFGPGALRLKRSRKAFWIAAARSLKLLKGVHLHGVSDGEAADIRRSLPWASLPLVAPNVMRMVARAPEPATRQEGGLRLVFLGRISPVKNLHYALRALKEVRAPVIYDVFGPDSDAAYASSCRALASTAPPQLTVRFRGEIAHDAVSTTLAEYDALFLPTLGENFGHAIFEALAAGTPVVISDRTAWRNLENQGAGFDLALETPSAFAAAIDRMAAMSAAERTRWRDGARALAERVFGDAQAVERSRAMLRAVLDDKGPAP